MRDHFPSLTLPASSVIDLGFEVSIAVETVPNQLEYETLVSLIHQFAKVGERGGFTDSSVQPSQSCLLVVSFSPNISSNYFCEMKAKSIDTRAFQLLRNMLARRRNQGIYVTRIVVNGLDQINKKLVALPELDYNNEYCSYPTLSQYIKFAVGGVDADFSKSRRCLIEMRNIMADTIYSCGVKVVLCDKKNYKKELTDCPATKGSYENLKKKMKPTKPKIG